MILLPGGIPVSRGRRERRLSTANIPFVMLALARIIAMLAA
jgi:hypothetical protein